MRVNSQAHISLRPSEYDDCILRKRQVTGLYVSFPEKSFVRANQILADNIPF